MLNAYNHQDPKGEKAKQRAWIRQAIQDHFGGQANNTLEVLFLDNCHLETTQQSCPIKLCRRIHVVECIPSTYESMREKHSNLSSALRKKTMIYHALLEAWMKNEHTLRKIDVAYLDYCGTINGNFALGHCPKRDISLLLKHTKRSKLLLAITVSQRYKRENPTDMSNVDELVEWHLKPYFTYYQFRYQILRTYAYQKDRKSMNMAFFLILLQKDKVVLPWSSLFLESDNKYFA